MKDVLALPDDFKIPAANPYQCGSWKLHSLAEAKQIAKSVLDGGIGITDSRDIALDPKKIAELA